MKEERSKAKGVMMYIVERILRFNLCVSDPFVDATTLACLTGEGQGIKHAAWRGLTPSSIRCRPRRSRPRLVHSKIKKKNQNFQ
jgi:hypothetical protein